MARSRLLRRAAALIEYQWVGRDITDRLRAEHEHRRFEAQRGIERTLRDADRRKDEFLAMLGHELRNPLAPVGWRSKRSASAAARTRSGATRST